MVRELLAHGADVNVIDRYQQSPLHLACRENYLDVVQTLLSHGSDVHAVTKRQNTPLHWACARGHLGVTSLLLSQGADPFSLNQDSQTPLNIALREGYLDLVDLFQAHDHCLSLQSQLTLPSKSSHSTASQDVSPDRQSSFPRL